MSKKPKTVKAWGHLMPDGSFRSQVFSTRADARIYARGTTWQVRPLLISILTTPGNKRSA